jgi:hypothetical protein
MLLVCPPEDWRGAIDLRTFGGDPTRVLKHVAGRLDLVIRVDDATRKLYLGLPRGGGRETWEETAGPIPGALAVTAAQAVAAARAWVGREFAPGVPAQCANFVRHLFESLGAPLPLARHPYDEPVCLRYGILPVTGPGLAAGLAGSEVGQVFPAGRGRPRAGDLVFFAGTYHPEGIPAEAVPDLVTHVGICTSAERMVDRSTSARPVSERPLSTFARLACYVRPFYRSQASAEAV